MHPDDLQWHSTLKPSWSNRNSLLHAQNTRSRPNPPQFWDWTDEAILTGPKGDICEASLDGDDEVPWTLYTKVQYC